MAIKISRDIIAKMAFESAMFMLWKLRLRSNREIDELNDQCERDDFRRKCESAAQ